MKNLFKRLRKQTAGVILLEYVILGFLVAALCIASIGVFGKTISNDFVTLSVASLGDAQGTLNSAAGTLAEIVTAGPKIDAYTSSVAWTALGVADGYPSAVTATYAWDGLPTVVRP